MQGLEQLQRHVHGRLYQRLLLEYRRCGELLLATSVDADWAGEPHRKSVSGGAMFLDRCCLAAWPTTQKTCHVISGATEFESSSDLSHELTVQLLLPSRATADADARSTLRWDC